MERKIYIDLDSMLDTRAGLLASIDAEKASDVILRPDYYVRKSNDFGWISGEEFNERFRKRDNSVLERAPVTTMTTKLNEFVEDILATPAYQYNRGKLSLCLNIYPYKLTKEEIEELEAIAMYYTNEMLPVEIVNTSPTFLTPSNFKISYDLVIMYDWGEWIQCHAPEIGKTSLRELTFFVPRVVLGSALSEEEMLDEGFDSPDKMMDFVEMVMAGSLGLEMCDVRLWCCLPPNAAPYESRSEKLAKAQPINR